MRTFPYEVQFFCCTNWNQSVEKLQEAAQFFTAQDALSVGGIQGETGIPGLKIDFNNGIRLQVPAGNWHVIIGDNDSGMSFYDQDVSEALIISMEKYYVHWQIEVFLDGELVFAHIFNPVGQKIRLNFNSKFLGDMLSFLSYVPFVRDKWEADVYCMIDDSMKGVFQRLLPEIRLREEAEENTYATFYFNASIDFPGWMPMDGRMVSMVHTGRIILGLPELPPKLRWNPGPRTIEEPYVCIGVQGSSVEKGWLYPDGWEELTAYLKEKGYRVLCIDRDKRLQEGRFVLEMPKGAEDFTGNRSLVERMDMLHYADFFVGLSSGLSWLAWTADCPVVMIAGFTAYWYEFFTPYRVYNRLACNGCYNDVRLYWKNNPCARQEKGSENEMQCSTRITPRMVMEAVDRLIADKREGKLPAYA